jgi:2-aminoethylphosphonate-pyruvate transaminase
MKRIKRNILLNPGPATTTDTVKYSLVVPDICPREKEFSQIMDQIRKDLVKIVNGDDQYTSILFAGSGTAVMDSVINSVVPKNKKIAIIVNGAYGERFIKIAKAYKIPYMPVEFEWGKELDLKKIEDVLMGDRSIGCIALVHHETTTGILNPVNDVGDLAKRYNCVFIVDAISSFAGMPIDILESHADFLLSTSNKCIQGIAGIAFIICKKSALETIKNYEKRSYYLDLYNQYSYIEETGQTPFTPPVQVVYALQQAIKEYFEEGGEQRYIRYSENWKILRSGLNDLGFTLLLPEESESHILLTVLEPEDPNYDFNQMHDYLYQRGFTIYPGKINQKSFRLANMGAIYPKDIKDFLKVLKQYLKEYSVHLGVTD